MYLPYVFGLTAALCASRISAQNEAEKLAWANNEFGFDLYRSLQEKGDTGNLFFSPLSITSALAMIYAGAASYTAQEMEHVLRYADYAIQNVHQTYGEYLNKINAGSDAYTFTLANAALVVRNLGVYENYKNMLKHNYNADLQEVDFEKDGSNIVNRINEWVKSQTKNKIQKLLDEVDPKTRFIVLNAVYFKGTWKTKFEASQTKPMDFYNGGRVEAVTKVPTMFLKSKIPYFSGRSFEAIRLPYKGENISMIVLLPSDPEGLAALERTLNAEMFQEILSGLFPTTVEVFLPKFKISYSKGLSTALKRLGLRSIFQRADLSNMAQHDELYLSEVLHKAVVEVNEEGSEAAAVTGGIINRIRPSLGSLPVVFRADHPFLFFIVDSRNNLILFSGKINKL